MKHPTLDYQGLEDILNLIPIGVPWFYVLYSYIIVALKRTNGNRTQAAIDINMPRRTLSFRFSAMEAIGYEIPKPKRSGGAKRSKAELPK